MLKSFKQAEAFRTSLENISFKTANGSQALQFL